MTTVSTTGPKTEPSRPIPGLRHIHLRVSSEKRQAIYDSIQAGSRADLEYAALVALAALIALFGLLQNSAAVIIGAMLISPMMTPLLAAALALLLGEGNLGRRASLVLGGSVVSTIAITWFVALLIPLNQLTPEILARTTPNLLDLFIAFLSGLAGTLALRGGPSSLMILPGVAIAVAVVPPLAVVGYGLSTRQFSIAAGAFLLFLTNLVAIVISSALVFRSMGFRPERAAEAGRWKLKYRVAISTTVLLVLSIPLFLTLRRAVSQIRVRSEVGSRLAAEFRGNKASVSDFSVSFAGHLLQVHATVRTTKYLDPSQIGAAEKSLQSHFGSNTRLQVDQILVAVGGVKPPLPAPAPSQNAISGGGVRPVQQAPPFDFKASEVSLIHHLQGELDGLLAASAIKRTAPLRPQLIDAPPSVIANTVLAAPQPIAPQTIRQLESQLSSRMAVATQLHGTVEMTGASYNFAFDAPPSARRLSAAHRRALGSLMESIVADPSLHLKISYSLTPATPSSQEPPLLRQLKALLEAAHMKASQYSISPSSLSNTPEPPASDVSSNIAESAVPSTAQGPAAAQVHYDFRVIQSF
jgi:uncharacterized hydrophobic protein (TIGR00271 family)